jgi:thiol-disulfide isomerase/thioredoxin
MMAKKKQKSDPNSLLKSAVLGLVTGLAVLGTIWAIPAVRNSLNPATEFAKVKGPNSDVPIAASSPINMKGKKMFNVQAYQAPELVDVTDWINSSPLTIAGLKGKVILLDFWTFGCINCQNTQPYLNKWQSNYVDKGLVVLGVHAPEFAYERVAENVRNAVKDAKIKYPVVLDNSFSTWNAYGNQYWPARYLIDKDGNVRYNHFGEGAYDETDNVIQTLLKEES